MRAGVGGAGSSNPAVPAHAGSCKPAGDGWCRVLQARGCSPEPNAANQRCSLAPMAQARGCSPAPDAAKPAVLAGAQCCKPAVLAGAQCCKPAVLAGAQCCKPAGARRRLMLQACGRCPAPDAATSLGSLARTSQVRERPPAPLLVVPRRPCPIALIPSPQIAHTSPDRAHHESARPLAGERARPGRRPERLLPRPAASMSRARPAAAAPGGRRGGGLPCPVG